MAKPKYNFKTNIRLKDIIGQGLINNSNIAIIELIKNAKDAKSKNVEITFKNAETLSEESKITIQDFGSGMDLDDIVNKWLNIAYSEKKHDETGSFAGDKGIGRFSCDRLGKVLNIYSKKSASEIVHLKINWLDFEVDDKNKEISSVELDPKYITVDKFLKQTKLQKFNKGTCLIIEDLREPWGKPQIERLKKDLERFIVDPTKSFEVRLKSEDVKDKEGNLVFDEVIENKLLLKLDEKTISIHSKINEEGDTIKTELRHYGETILSFEEDNIYSKLKDIVAQIHYLNTGAKISFKSITGYTSTEYGSIMLSYNSFRVMPYGEPKDDWLGLNQRKLQGTQRYFGTRELFGIVEISDKEKLFKPVSSREGMEHNDAFKQLTESDLTEYKIAYIPNILNILQKYVVSGIDWDRVLPEEEAPSFEDIKKTMMTVLESYKGNKKLRNIFVNSDLVSKIAEVKVAESNQFNEEIRERVSNKSIYDLTKSDKKHVLEYVERHDRILANKEATNKEYKDEIVVEKKRRLFAESHLTSDTQRIRNLQHLIGVLNGESYSDLEEVLYDEAKGMPLSKEELLDVIKSVHFRAAKVSKLSQIITHANFDMMSETIHHNISSYIHEYIEDLHENGASWGLKTSYELSNEFDLTLNFSPLEVSMLVDNICSNAYKAEAKNICIKSSVNSSAYILEFVDDGEGLSDKYKPEDYFKAGISTTSSGSGVGLNHVQQIVKDLDGNVEIYSNKTKGTTIKIWWEK